MKLITAQLEYDKVELGIKKLVALKQSYLKELKGYNDRNEYPPVSVIEKCDIIADAILLIKNHIYRCDDFIRR